MKRKKIVIVLIFTLLTLVLQADIITEMEKKILQISSDIAPNVVQIDVELKKGIKEWRYTIENISGCGLILNDENYIVTNYHISDKDNIKSVKIKFSDSDEAVNAVLVGSDEMNDLALLRVESIPYKVKPLKWGNIDNVKAGQFVIAIGDPLGLEKTISFGMISKVQRDLLTYEVNPFIQSDIRIDSGNSGGPLINMKGEVIGINNKMNNFAFSVPVDVVLESIEKMKHGNVRKPYFGLETQKFTENHRKFFQDDSLAGVIFHDFAYNSPAVKTDLKSGDIIIGVNDEMITEDIDKSVVYYRRLINECEIGKKATLTVWRFGKIHKVKFKVIEEPQRVIQNGFDCDNWGFILKEYTSKLKFKEENNYSAPIKVGQMYIDSFPDKRPNRELERGEIIAGIVVDNEILEINDIDDLKKAYEKHKDDEIVMFKVLARNSNYFTILKKLDRSLESLED